MIVPFHMLKKALFVPAGTVPAILSNIVPGQLVALAETVPPVALHGGVPGGFPAKLSGMIGFGIGKVDVGVPDNEQLLLLAGRPRNPSVGSMHSGG